MVTFTELAPGSYFLKLYVDLNRNGSWDGGIYPSTPPEPVRYLPKGVSVQAHFATEEQWGYDATPLSKQRPSGLEGTSEGTSANKNSGDTQKRDLNKEYIQRMRDRYGKRWNPTDRERKIMGMPSREEERLARERGELPEEGTEAGKTPTDSNKQTNSNRPNQSSSPATTARPNAPQINPASTSTATHILTPSQKKELTPKQSSL